MAPNILLKFCKKKSIFAVLVIGILIGYFVYNIFGANNKLLYYLLQKYSINHPASKPDCSNMFTVHGIKQIFLFNYEIDGKKNININPIVKADFSDYYIYSSMFYCKIQEIIASVKRESFGLLHIGNNSTYFSQVPEYLNRVIPYTDKKGQHFVVAETKELTCELAPNNKISYSYPLKFKISEQEDFLNEEDILPPLNENSNIFEMMSNQYFFWMHDNSTFIDIAKKIFTNVNIYECGNSIIQYDLQKKNISFISKQGTVGDFFLNKDTIYNITGIANQSTINFDNYETKSVYKTPLLFEAGYIFANSVELFFVNNTNYFFSSGIGERGDCDIFYDDLKKAFLFEEGKLLEKKFNMEKIRKELDNIWEKSGKPMSIIIPKEYVEIRSQYFKHYDELNKNWKNKFIEKYQSRVDAFYQDCKKRTLKPYQLYAFNLSSTTTNNLLEIITDIPFQDISYSLYDGKDFYVFAFTSKQVWKFNPLTRTAKVYPFPFQGVVSANYTDDALIIGFIPLDEFFEIDISPQDRTPYIYKGKLIVTDKNFTQMSDVLDLSEYSLSPMQISTQPAPSKGRIREAFIEGIIYSGNEFYRKFLSNQYPPEKIGLQ